MSLRVWLPLNGALDNQGLDQITVTNNGAIIDNNGKIGKCYSFDGNSSGININGNIISTLAQGDFSICFWVYNDDQGNRSIYIATIPSSSYAFAIQKTTGEGLRVYWQSSPDYYPTNFTIPVQEWCHITVVIKNNNCYCYKNGILITSKEDGSFTPQKLTYTWLYGMLGRDLRTGATVLKGKMNDFRWYDHALSPMEVKQISQGLILHYPLNRNGWGQENLIANSNVEKSGKGSNLILYDLTTTGVSTVLGKTMRISADIKSDTTNSILDCYVRSSTSQSMCSNTIFTNIGTDYKRYSTTTICNTNQSSTPQWFAFRSNGANGTTSTATFTIKNVKLEIGKNTTPWSPASSDELATTMGLNDNVEYDTSGYGNNGTKIGTFDYDSDTPKYNVSTKIAASATGIKLTNFSIGNIWSMSVWFKYPSQDNTGWKALVILNNSGSDSDLQFGNYINCNDGRIQYSANGKYNSSSVHLIFGEWNHLVSTYDGTTLRCYFNGEYKASLTPGQTLSNKSNLGVGFKSNAVDFSTFGASMTNGLLSDVRVYATTLSADDVKSLYNNSAYIDNQGNIYGAIYEEV